MRTQKQKEATKRNHEIMRLKGIMAHTQISLFTGEESNKINEICRAALIRNGVSYQFYDDDKLQQEIKFSYFDDKKIINNKLDVKC
jgi:hypothetical protein